MNSKALAYLAFAVLLCSSCLTEEIVDVKDKSPKVVMNAQFTTLANTWKVALSKSAVTSLENMDGVEVWASVNGGAAEKGTPWDATVKDEWLARYCTEYYFGTKVNPGDRLSISANTPEGVVSADFDVPTQINMDSVDTLRTIIHGMYSDDEYFQFKIKITDPAETDDYYRLRFYKTEEFVLNGEWVKITTEIRGDGSADPVITDGQGASSTDLLSELIGGGNDYLVFSDDLFSGETRTIRINFYHYYLSASFNHMDPSAEYKPGYVTVVLEHLSFAHYHYYRALQNMETIGYEMTFIFEPSRIPVNVNGGLGFVGVEAASEPVTFQIPHDWYDPFIENYYSGD